MPSLQIREMPAVLYGTLQEHARREHRSLAQQAVVTLARGMEITEEPRKRRQALLARINEARLVLPDQELPDSAELLNEDRAR